MLRFYEFFAGGGMARAGLGPDWHCAFANDFDLKKSLVYADNWESDTLVTQDVRKLSSADLPGEADLVWASFPCQDLSLAGGGAGLKGNRSGTFWPFWDLMLSLVAERRAPGMIVLENVCGTLTSHGGTDFAAICTTLDRAGYQYGAIVVDAVRFVPQSRPRLFIIAARAGFAMPEHIFSDGPTAEWHTRALRKAYDQIPTQNKQSWIWWNPEVPPPREKDFAEIIEEHPDSVRWHTPEETRQLLEMMSPINLAKVEQAKHSGLRAVGGVYKRTRRTPDDNKIQRAEIRFDKVAGCLRTPSGGSSRQLIVVVEDNIVRSRLLSTREAARLMGLPDTYRLPTNYNEAYHLVGDGVAVPVVAHLAATLFEPVLAQSGDRELASVA